MGPPGNQRAEENRKSRGESCPMLSASATGNARRRRMRMRPAIYTVAMIAGLSAAHQTHASQPGDLCSALREFVESVPPDGSRALTFRTIWGDKFKDAVDPALAAKRCEHGGYAP